jgi:hypothetical protein
MISRNISFSCILLLFLTACTNNPLDISIDGIKTDLAFVNVDSTLFYSDSTELMNKHLEFKSEIENIYAYEIGHCLQIGDLVDSAFYNRIMLFRSDSTIQKLEKSIQMTFKDKSEIESKITDGFNHLKYHFPKGKQPTKIVYLNALFNSGVFCTETEIGIGLERFLGESNEIIKRLPSQYYFDWMKKAMDKQYLERDVLAGWIETHYVDEASGSLAEHIVRAGKVMYLTEAAFPNEDPSLILRYSKEDYQWALDNEYEFWKYLVDENLLFKIDERNTVNMINEGPFTPGLPGQDSPDRLGQFLGWRMIHSYMEQYDVSVAELMKLSFNEILQAYEID